MIDLNDMRRKAEYCAERAENSVHHDVCVHWRDAADAWLYAVDASQKTSRIIDEWDWIKSSQASLTSPVVLSANRQIGDLLPMPDPTDLTEEKLRRTFTKLNRSRAVLEDDIRKSQLNRVRSKLARERRQRKELRTAPRLIVVTE